jgi:hypothetical protein
MRLAATLLVLVTVAQLGVAESSVAGNINSNGPFRVRGVLVSAAGVPDWPIVVGDEIATDGSEASLTLADGTRVTLAKHTKALIEKTEKGIRVRLKAGTLKYQELGATSEFSALGLPSIPSVFTEGALAAANGQAAFSSGRLAVIPATPTTITPANLGYLQSLRNTPDNQTPPPVPPPPVGGGGISPLSPIRP